MNKNLIAKASIEINAPISRVWEAITKPEIIKQYMFNTNVISDWKKGGTIIWKGEWEGKPYEDKGVIVKIEPETFLQVTHSSYAPTPEGEPTKVHILTYELQKKGDKTTISLSQDNNKDEEERSHSQKMWEMMLESLKKLLEK